jgi:alpha-glucosidase (family GH31 glycosyl hydrolase)
MTTIPSHFRIAAAPQADPAAIVRLPGVRITVLTPRLLRLEYDPGESFEDRPSQVFWRRRQPVPPYQAVHNGPGLALDTAALSLRYTPGERPGFRPDSLAVTLKPGGETWRFGDPETGNLGGTLRTLDTANGPRPLEPGLIARSGWKLVDDSAALLIAENGWLAPRQASAGALDLYFFGYGQQYQQALIDFRAVSGDVPLLPRWALGNWWSRYWAYSQQELTSLMADFQAHQVPLAVCIIDMDWHITKTGNQSSGWTGYTWNRQLFPDPPGFLAHLHSLGLKTALNLHPADGIHPHEAQYAQMAERLGLDPASQQPVRFDLEDPDFTNAYLDLLHHPQEAAGVDFWWMDWQQGNPTRLPGLNLLWWINHLHFLDLGRKPEKRSFVFSRWGGLSNHRYPIGFSGDAIVSWESLAFQPYLTATAANVAYGWWSHDIGGHMDGVEDPELYTRWVQFGVFSPIMRLHSTANPFHERRPWGYDAETLRVTRQALQLRHALIPYLYSMAWREHKDGLSLARPMYLLHPSEEPAYACPNQYAYGSELLVAPFLAPRHPETRLSRVALWLPQGDWYGFFDEEYSPGGWRAVYGGLEDIPIFARAGAIVPLAPYPAWGGLENPAGLTLHVFAGQSNRFELYEDDGESQAYRQRAFVITPYTLSWSEDRLSFQVGPAEGDLRQAPARRGYRLVFHALQEPAAVLLRLNSKPLAVEWRYDPAARCLTIDGISLAPADVLQITLEGGDHPLAWRESRPQRVLEAMIRAFKMGSEAKKALATCLPDLLTDPTRLAVYKSALSSTQLRALLETLTGGGVDDTSNSGERLIVLWNPRGQAGLRYSMSVERSWIGRPGQRFEFESGIVPAFKWFRPTDEFGASPAALQLDYAQLLRIQLTHAAQDAYPRPAAGIF